MPFDWREYLKFARFCAGGRIRYAQEARFRTGVSRAYYAAFCLARNYAVKSLGFQPQRDPKDHVRLKDYLKKKQHTAIAQDLDDLRQWRNQCDYDDTTNPHPRIMIHAAIMGADRIIRQL